MKWLFINPCKCPRFTLASALALVLTTFPLASPADTVASLLGNFTINQYCGLRLSNESVEMHYAVVFGQLPALRELHLADVNGDGVTSQAERDDYVRRLAPEFARRLQITLDGVAVPLRLTHWTSSLPTEQGGFSLRLDADFSGALALVGANSVHRLGFVNRNYEGRIGWREITVETLPAIQVFDTNAYGTSLTAGLTEAVKVLPATGPLEETSVQMSFTRGALPRGAVSIQPRPGAVTNPTVPGGAQGGSSKEPAWLQVQTRRLVDLISTPTVAPHVALLALLIALVLGALHALSPGHGKTIVGAYLIGSRGTAKHAAFLGLTVTITHTLGVFALGFATLFASRYVVPEKLFPILSLASGLLVLGMGMVLLAQRWRGARTALAPRFSEDDRRLHPVFVQHAHEHGIHTHQQAEHGHGQAHSHAHEHDHDHGHGHGQHDDHGLLTHSHGGSVHSHLPPGADGAPVTWHSLLALGISGGLIPCPSAMVLLLAAVALNKTAYGLALVLAFSVGLAMTLTAIGLAFVYTRDRLRVLGSAGRWTHLLPVLSAGLITLVGAGLCITALQSHP